LLLRCDCFKTWVRLLVSKRIAILGKALGVTLFHGTARRVAVTDDGERVHPSAQRIFEGVEHTMRLSHSARMRVCVSFMQQQQADGPFALRQSAIPAWAGSHCRN
jgi:DNA-binding transcriptional LysR family regulator